MPQLRRVAPIYEMFGGGRVEIAKLRIGDHVAEEEVSRNNKKRANEGRERQDRKNNSCAAPIQETVPSTGCGTLC